MKLGTWVVLVEYLRGNDTLGLIFKDFLHFLKTYHTDNESYVDYRGKRCKYYTEISVTQDMWFIIYDKKWGTWIMNHLAWVTEILV